MSGDLILRNRQRTRKIQSTYLRTIIRAFLEGPLRRQDYELGVHLVDRTAISKLNEAHLGHRGPTDVITFDYADPAHPEWLGGDIFVCVPEAVAQAWHFGTTWQSEVVRYIVHGVLHLCGYDDQSRRARMKMKKQEDRLVTELANQFELRKLGSRI